MATELLLLEDVDSFGRSGEVVKVKPGFARNFLIPQRKAVFADANTLRMQKRLREERAKQAALDLEESKAIASHIEGLTETVIVKVDPDGHLYGSVSAVDIVNLLRDKGIRVEKRFVQLAHPIKTTGVFPIVLRMKEGVEATMKLKILPEEGSIILDSNLVKDVSENKAPEQETTQI